MSAGGPVSQARLPPPCMGGRTSHSLPGKSLHPKPTASCCGLVGFPPEAVNKARLQSQGHAPESCMWMVKAPATFEESETSGITRPWAKAEYPQQGKQALMSGSPDPARPRPGREFRIGRMHGRERGNLAAGADLLRIRVGLPKTRVSSSPGGAGYHLHRRCDVRREAGGVFGRRRPRFSRVTSSWAQSSKWSSA